MFFRTVEDLTHGCGGYSKHGEGEGQACNRQGFWQHLRVRVSHMLRGLIRGCSLAGGLCLFATVTRADLWCTAYYPGYEQGGMAASNIDFSVVTHVVHFSVLP